MPRDIGGGGTLLTRRDWGADPREIAVGHPRTPADWKRVVFHHTVIIDNDATPNLWTNAAEVKAKMRQLQKIRPDLGSEVPYSFVLFLMEDGSLVVCEGRGTRRTGAHTIGHNSEWLGQAFEGDFENFTQDIRRWIPRVNHWNYWLREEGCVNLRPPFMVHQDTTQTACPGSEVISRRELFSYAELVTVAPPPQEDADMADPQARAAIAVLIESAHLQQAELDHHTAQITFLSEVAVGLKKLIDDLGGGTTVDPAATAELRQRLGNVERAAKVLATKVAASAAKLKAAGEALKG